jgi:thymidylate kinase
LIVPGIIAVVGCDGSGKSTLTADLLSHLASERPTGLVYLGQSSGDIVEWIGRWPLIGPAAERYLRRKGQSAHRDEDKPPSPDIPTAVVVHLLSRWRHFKFRRMLRLARRGFVVVTDRYPQAEVPGFYFDGPGLISDRAAGSIVRWLTRREQRLYERMARHVPPLLIRLNIDAETAHARKPDHKLSMLRDKVRVIPALRFNGARILDLDGTSPYPQVLHAALAEARAALEAKPA